jgi:peptidoglycan/LPS O-acetylase OafA/YrhL
MAAMGGEFLIGHTALAILMPLAVLALAVSYWSHRQPLALGLGVLAVGIAYVHIFGGTPEWTLAVVLGLSLVAAVMDWRVAGSKASRVFSRREVRRLDSSG